MGTLSLGATVGKTAGSLSGASWNLLEDRGGKRRSRGPAASWALSPDLLALRCLTDGWDLHFKSQFIYKQAKSKVKGLFLPFLSLCDFSSVTYCFYLLLNCFQSVVFS